MTASMPEIKVFSLLPVQAGSTNGKGKKAGPGDSYRVVFARYPGLVTTVS